jgi:hypothetical protein
MKPVIRAAGGGSAERVGDGAPRTRTTGGGTRKLQREAQWRRGSTRRPWAKGPEARAGTAGQRRNAVVDDVGEQATRHALHSLSLFARKNVFSECKLGDLFTLVARGLLTNIARCSSGLASSFPSAETPPNACTFLSEKSPLGFRGAFFYHLSR